MRVKGKALGLVMAAALGGCGTDLSDLASFIDSPFGDISDNVTTLDEPGVEKVMNELMRRFNGYLALRAAVPFENIAPEECITDVKQGSSSIAFTGAVDCMFAGSATPLIGTIDVKQVQLASSPVGVFKFDLGYNAVSVGTLTVDGTEKITETQDAEGASVRVLELTQNGEAFDYEFRAGLVDGETPVFDYQIPSKDGDVVARITNPTSIGGFVTVFLNGLDGTLACEVRAADPARPPRGTCDNGVVFGLPE